MNKLVSKNPIQRFKQGRKIVKAESGWRIDPYTGRYINPVNRQTITKEEYKQYKLNKLKNAGFIDNNNHWIGSTTTQKQDKKRSQDKIPINWNQQYTNFSNDLTTAQKAWLTNEGVDYNNVESVQNYLLGKLGKNALGRWGADKRWGPASQAAWNKFASQTDFTPKVSISPEQIEKDRKTIINQVLPQPKLPTIPTEGISNFTPLSTARTYNKADVRDFIRNKGRGAYDFSGSQRKALRMVLNGQGTDEDKAVVKAMGLFKQGGQLISKNPVKRFKLRTKI